LTHFLHRLPIVWRSTTAADAYGAIKRTLNTQGTPIGDFGALIAAHVVAEQLTLVTRNVRHFVHVPDLKHEDWLA